MRLLAHNVMASHVKGVKNGYPFKLDATSINILEADFDIDFVRTMLPRLNYAVLRQASFDVRLVLTMPRRCGANFAL